MNRRIRFRVKSILIVVAGFLAISSISCSGKGCSSAGIPGPEGKARNVILFIGDGMGAGQIEAAGMYRAGAGGTLSFEAFPHRGYLSTLNAEGGVTDSAAAATAMATGSRVSNGVLAVAIPGNGRPLGTVLELLGRQGKRTGLVTTTFITHATPAAFASHVASRDDYGGIAVAYLNDSHPNLLFGGGGHIRQADAKEAGYTVVTDRDDMMRLNTVAETHVFGSFGDGHIPFEYDGLADLPHLSEMTQVALRILENAPDGFFLMVEGGRIDHACHANDTMRAILETIEFSDAVEIALDWARSHPETLILVTADHETGGLIVAKNNGAGVIPTVSWSTSGHTAANVPVYGWGAGAERVSGIMENTEIFQIMMKSSTRHGSSRRLKNQDPTTRWPRRPGYAPLREKEPVGFFKMKMAPKSSFAVPGLYFCGEVESIDKRQGLKIAWSKKSSVGMVICS
jgi:alkaline phosphatase